MRTSVNAYAKINLFLDIESIRENGYHNIISYMQSVTLHDIVTVEHIPSGEECIRISCDDVRVPCNEKNLAYKAADAFPAEHGTVNIHIRKRIPMEAGLAGGSADAAATLLALNRIFGNKLSEDELISLGNKLGADVPFCIKTGSCMAMGTGDVLKEVLPMQYLPILIAREGEGMSTPFAYRELDNKFNHFENYSPHISQLDILLSDKSISPEEYVKGFYNIFESVVEPVRPFVTLIKSTMNACGALSSMMSGSGTAVFGIFKTESDAETAKRQLALHGIESDICYPCKK